MEQVSQNPQVVPQVNQVPDQIPEQSSKKWLKKYLLIGIFGGILFALIVSIVVVIVTLIYLSLTTPKELVDSGATGMGALAAATLMVFFVAPLTWAIFFVATLYVGYRRYRYSPELGIKRATFWVDLAFLLLGGIVGFGLNFFIFTLSIFFGFQGFYYDVNLLIYPLNVIVGAYLFLKLGHLWLKKVTLFSFIQQPLVWVSLLFTLLGIMGYFWSVPQGEKVPQETLTIEGSVRYADMEGGCWYIEVESECTEPDKCPLGRIPYYQPINLPGELKKMGAKVKFKLEPQTGIATICQIGPVVKILEYQIVK